jgi:two-component system sensor histidine kinase TctE
LRQQADFRLVEWDSIVRDVAVDLSPLIAQKDLDFELTTSTCSVHGHEWMLRELVRNLLHNAIHHCRDEGVLRIHLIAQTESAQLIIRDSGPGIDDDLRLRLFQPFATGNTRSGTGLGLTIVREIVAAMAGSIQMNNCLSAGNIVGMEAIVTFPLSTPVEPMGKPGVPRPLD